MCHLVLLLLTNSSLPSPTQNQTVLPPPLSSSSLCSDSRGEELELQQLCFAQHGADEEALLASWQDTLFAWSVRAFSHPHTFFSLKLKCVVFLKRHSCRLCSSDGGMPRDIDLRKLQAFGSEIVDMLAQAPDRVYVALAEGKIMVLDRLLVKHVLRCAQPILPSVSGVTLQKQKLFLLPHETTLRCIIVTNNACAFCLWFMPAFPAFVFP